MYTRVTWLAMYYTNCIRFRDTIIIAGMVCTKTKDYHEWCEYQCYCCLLGGHFPSLINFSFWFCIAPNRAACNNLLYSIIIPQLARPVCSVAISNWPAWYDEGIPCNLLSRCDRHLLHNFYAWLHKTWSPSIRWSSAHAHHWSHAQ